MHSDKSHSYSASVQSVQGCHLFQQLCILTVRTNKFDSYSAGVQSLQGVQLALHREIRLGCPY